MNVSLVVTQNGHELAFADAAACEQRLAERVTLRVPDGELFVRAGPRKVELAGPAEYVFEGTM